MFRFDEHASSPASRGSDPRPTHDTIPICQVRAPPLYSARSRLEWKLHLVLHLESTCLTTSEASAAIFFLLLAIAQLLFVCRAVARSRLGEFQCLLLMASSFILWFFLAL